MSKLEESIGFYRKMSDLQEKLRRSEEERLQLEEKFALLMRACRDEEEVRLNNLRERYEAFLEEEKHRKERNDRILQTLGRIESRAAILTAKSERLKLLRKHYEGYMCNMYPGWNNRLAQAPQTQSERNLPYAGLTSFSADVVKAAHIPSYHHYPSSQAVSHTLSSVSHPYQPLPSSTQPYPAVNQPLPPSTQPYPVVNQPLPSSTQSYSAVNQPLPPSTQPYPAVNQPLPPSTQPYPAVNQPLLSSMQPYPTVNQPLPPSTQPHSAANQPLISSTQPYPGINQPSSASTQAYPSTNQHLPPSKQPYTTINEPLHTSHPYPAMNQSLSSASHPYSTVNNQPYSFQPYPYMVPGVRQNPYPLSSQQPTPVLAEAGVSPQLTTQPMSVVEVNHTQQVEPSIGAVQKPHQDQLKKMDQIDGYIGRAAEMLSMSAVDGNDDKSMFQNLNEVMPQSLKDNKHLGNSIDIELEQNTSGDILNVTLSDDGILQDEPSKTIQQHGSQDISGGLDAKLLGGGDSFMPQNSQVKENIPTRAEEQVMPAEVSETQEQTSLETGQYAEQQQWDENAAQYYEQDGQYYQYGDEMYQQEYAEGEYDQQYAEGEYDQQYDQQYAEYTEQEYQEYQQQQDNQNLAYSQGNQLEQKQQQHEEQTQEGDTKTQNSEVASAEEIPESGTNKLGENEKIQEKEVEELQSTETKEQKSNEAQQADGGEELVRVQQADGEGLVRAQQADGEGLVRAQQADGEGLVRAQQEDDGEGLARAQQADGEGLARAQQADGEGLVRAQQADGGDSESSRDDVKVGEMPQQSELSSDVTVSSEKVEQYRQLLGVPAAGEPETSDTDELEAQLAALVDTKHDEDKQKQQALHTVGSEPGVKPVAEDTTTSSDSKQEPAAAVEPVMAQKTSRPVSKKLPDLNKVLESDSESLQLDATVSNADSDDFDFSSGK